MKNKVLFIFILLLLTSCNNWPNGEKEIEMIEINNNAQEIDIKSNQEEKVNTTSTGETEENKLWEAVEETKTQETILESNNNENTMKNIQTQGLVNGDIVAVMKTTNGTIQLKLFTDLVPETTTNFIGLSQNWYYKDVIFHRVIKWFMIQWGDPDGTGMWGESIYWEKFDDEFSSDLKNIKYSISMANAWPDTNGSQFFINEADNSFLDNKHSVFGQVVEWTETVDKIAKAKTWTNDRPEKEIKIISIEIKEYNNWSLKDYKLDVDSYITKLEEDKKIESEAKKTKTIEAWDNIAVHYTWTLENWDKFDSSLDRNQTLDFEVWAWMMIKWFDSAVVWMKIWDKKSITLEPKDAYGEIDDTKKQVIPKKDLASFEEAWIKLEVWSVLPTQYWEFKIVEVTDTEVTIDVNHALAGKTLNFDIEIIDIK